MIAFYNRASLAAISKLSGCKLGGDLCDLDLWRHITADLRSEKVILHLMALIMVE